MKLSLKDRLPKLKAYQIKLNDVMHSGYFKMHRYLVEYVQFNGQKSKIHAKEVVVTKNSVGALLYDPNKKQIALIQQFRIAPSAHQIIHQPKETENPWKLEVVAGTIDEGEAIPETLKREIKEESGLEMKSYEYIGSFYLCPGYSTEKMHAFCAEVDLDHFQEFAGLESENEDIAVSLFDYAEIAHLCGQTTIFPTFALLQWFLINKVKD